MQPPAAVAPPDTAPGGTPGGAGSPRARALRTIVAIGVGLGLLGFVIYHADVDRIHEHMAVLGWFSPLVLLPCTVITCADALGWRCTLPPSLAARVPFPSFVLVRMAGEAVNSVTPTAAVGGEPVKAHLLRAWGIPLSDGIASIVIAKTALTVSQSLFVVVGVAALCERSGRRELGAGLVALLLLGTAAFTLVLVRLQRRQPVTTAWGWASRLAPRSRLLARIGPSARAIDERLAEFYRVRPDAFRRASAWHLVGWFLGVTEVALIMYLIGAPVTWLDALVIEALSQPIRAASVVIPGALGTQEAGGVLLCTLLGMPVDQAATLWLLKRGRELVFDAIGLAYLARRTGLRAAGRA